MAGQLTIDTLKASSGVLATQNGMTGIAKAWANWVGSTAVILNSFNVSSVTRTGGGYYTINFTTAMPSANYAYAISANNYQYTMTMLNGGIPKTASNISVITVNQFSGTTTVMDESDVSVIVFSS